MILGLRLWFGDEDLGPIVTIDISSLRPSDELNLTNVAHIVDWI